VLRKLSTKQFGKPKVYDKEQMIIYRENHAASASVSAVDILMSLIKPSDYAEANELLADPEDASSTGMGDSMSSLKGWSAKLPEINDPRSHIRLATSLESMVNQQKYMAAVMFYNRKLKEGLRPTMEILKWRLKAVRHD
jgi:hypothetical protein